MSGSKTIESSPDHRKPYAETFVAMKFYREDSFFIFLKTLP
jgi:hypothetical protein